MLLATFTVVSTADNPNTAVANDGTLRGEILGSNAAPAPNNGLNLINFALPSGVQTINLRAALPSLTAPVNIDGSSAAGYNPGSPSPLININGSGSVGTGLTAMAGGVQLQELAIYGFTGDGIDLVGGNAIVTGCYVGVDALGNASGNLGQGILVSSANNTIGTQNTTSGVPANPNVISANGIVLGSGSGIQITGNLATGNVVTSSYIGTDPTGKRGLGNDEFGIEIDSPNNTIGALSANGPNGIGNLISGNADGGIEIANRAALISVLGNYIGTDITGNQAIPNGAFGINTTNVQNITIGGTTPGAGNVISGNKGYGVEVTNAGTRNVNIQGNDIGVGPNGIVPNGNTLSGVLVLAANGVTVGGTNFVPNGALQFGNIIANNGFSGAPNNQWGVEIRNGQNDGILGNSIYNNAGLGIKLTSGNTGIAPPTIIDAESGAGLTRIDGSYFGIPNTNYRIQFFSSPTPNASGAGDGKNFLADYDIITNNTGQATFQAMLSQGVPVGDIISATITQGPLTVNNTSQFSPNVPVVQAKLTDLSVTTAVPPSVPLLDQNYTYTFTITNGGPDPATGVVFTDKLPTNATFVSSSLSLSDPNVSLVGNVLTYDIPSTASAPFPANAPLTVTVTVKPNSIAGAFTNTASVTGNELDTDLTNNTSVTTATVAPDSDLSVSLFPSASPAPVGSPITYTLVVGNNGPSTAHNTTETVNLPASFSSVVVIPDQGTYSIDGSNTVTINTGILPASGTSTITIMATPTDVGTLNVTATATATEIDPNPSNNTVTVPVTIANAADLGVDIQANPDPVLVGQELFYTIDVTNNGPSAATSPTVVDQLPANVTYVPADSTAGSNGTLTFANGTVTASLFALLPGGVYPITIAVIPTVSGQVTNTVTVGDPDEVNPVEIDPDLTNNTATTTTEVSPADVQVVVNNPVDPLFIGQNAVYTLTVTNNGPADATNVLLNDAFAGGANIVSITEGAIGLPATVTGSSFMANLGTIPSGVTENITVTVTPTQAGYTGTLINSASVSSDEFDPDTNNNTSSSSNLVSPVELGVLMAGNPNPVLVGQPLVYVVAVTNDGPAIATNVLVNDALPAGVTFDSVTSDHGSLSMTIAGTLTGDLGTLAPGETAIITILVTPNTIETATNTATVTADNLVTNGVTNGTIPNSVSTSTSVSVINLPGTIAFGTSTVLVPENAGSVTLTLERTGGSLGAVTVDYATSDFTAIAGVNYVASSGTVTFADGQTTATITIGVLDDAQVDGDHQFLVTLSNPTGGASLGAQSAVSVDVTNTDRDTIPPFVSNLVAIPNGSSINGFKLTFDKAMDLGRVSLLSNYHLFITNAGKAQTPVPLAGVSYDPTTNTVTLIPFAPLPANRFYHIVVNGSFGPALTDTSGNILFGSSGLGTNYDVFYGQGTKLTYDDSQNNVVTIQLSGGGTLAIFRGANGDAASVNLLNIVPHKSKLTGSVKKLNKKASGHTIIGSINGFGRFGNVFSTLTTPAFYVESAPVSAASFSVADPVSITTPKAKAVVAKSTPKGPQHKIKK